MKTIQRPHFDYADNGGRPIAFAHRGGDAAGAEKENTLVAFRSAVRLGYTYLELDVILSADNKVVAFHGSKNARAETKTGLPLRSLLQSKTYAQLRRDHPIGGEPIPLLEEVLKEFPSCRINIDPKTKEVVEPLARLIRRMKVVDRVGIGSFSYKRTQGVAELLGGQHMVYTTLGPWQALALKANLSTYLEHTEAAGLQLPFKWVTPAMVRGTHNHGLDLHVWTPNSAEDMATALDKGVDGVMTDNVRGLKKVMQDGGVWRDAE